MLIYCLLVVGILINQQSLSRANEKPARCAVVKNDVYDFCTRKKLRFSTLEERSRIDDDSEVTCRNEATCSRNFTISYVRRQMHSKHIFMQLKYLMDDCCGNCVSYHVFKTMYQLSDVSEDVLNKSDIIFPILGKQSMKTMYGLHYIPIFEVPSAFYITLYPTSSENMASLIMGCLHTWPLMLICVLFSLLSGFIIWLMERKINRSEFPKRFFAGLAEGFWWSFVSMTTVGYGDKTPRSTLGRAFAVIWILIGIVIFSMLTATLTNNIMIIQGPPAQELSGKSIGTLSNRFHDSTMIAEHGGVYKPVHFNNTIVGIMILLRKLERKEIDGVLLNRVSWYYLRWALKNVRRYKDYETKFHSLNLHLTEVDYLMGKPTTGILVKRTKDYEYFRGYFEDNWITIQNCKDFDLSERANKWRHEATTTFLGPLFLHLIYAVIVIIVVIFSIGLLIEARSSRGLCKARKDQNEVVNIEQNPLSTQET